MSETARVSSRLRNFVSNHGKGVLVGGLVIGGCVLLSRYAQSRLKKWRDREAVQYFERNHKLQHFENISKTYNQTVTILLNKLNADVMERFDTETIIADLKAQPTDKLEMWNRLKIQVFAKVTYIIYATLILVLILKVQMSLVGGYLYKDRDHFPAELQEKYLLCCQSLLDRGLNKLHRLIIQKSTAILNEVDLKTSVWLHDIDGLFQEIKSGVSGDRENPLAHMEQFLYPSIEQLKGEVTETVVEETVELLSSDEMTQLAESLLDSSYQVLMKQLAEYCDSGNNGSENLDGVVKKPLVKLLPILNGLISSKVFPQQMLFNLVVNDKLQAWAANIYESCL